MHARGLPAVSVRPTFFSVLSAKVKGKKTRNAIWGDARARALSGNGYRKQ